MVLLKLDPKYPIVWRSPVSIQLGGRQPLVVLDPVTPAEERMLGALVKGVPEDGLAVHGRCAERVADDLLARVSPALLAPPPPSLAITVRVRDPQSRRIAELARALGLLSSGAPSGPDGSPADRSPDSPADRTPPTPATSRATPALAPGHRVEAGLFVGSHAIPPVAYRDWMRRDLPHIGIVFGDTGVQISPVVVPGRTPCLRCADLHRRDEDPCWPAVATQLITTPAAAAEDPLLRLAALSTAVRRLREVLISGATSPDPGPSTGPGTRTRSTGPGSLRRPRGETRALSIALDGRASASEAPLHPECGCLVDLQLASRVAA